MKNSSHKLYFLHPRHCLTELLQITYLNTTSDLVSTFYIVLSFCQIAGYVFKVEYTDLTDSKMLFILEALYYSNFANLLFYFSDTTITYVAFYGLLATLHFIILFPIISLILKRLFPKVSENPASRIMHFLFRKLFESFLWVLLVPTLEFAMNITDCESFSYISENRNNDTCVIPNYIWFLAVWLCALSFAISIVYLWTYTENTFLDTKSVKMNFTSCYLIVFLSRFIFIILFPVIYNKNSNLVYVFLNAIGITSIVDYVYYFPIRNPQINSKYIGFLLALQAYLSIATLWGIWEIVPQENLFYVMVICVAMGYKLGDKLRFKLYLRILKSNFQSIQTRTYLLEEMVYLFQNIKKAEKESLLYGLLRHHVKKCRESKCKLMDKHVAAFEISTYEDDRAKILNDFILQTFQKTIIQISKPGCRDHGHLEAFLMKYCSFLTNFNPNPLKAFFEIQKIMKKHTNTTFIFRCFKAVLIKATKATILTKDKEKALALKNHQQSEKELEVNSFLEILKEKFSFEAEAHHLLKEKIRFWEKYKDGMGSYEEIMREISCLVQKIQDFKKTLIKSLNSARTRSRPLFTYKMLSLVHSVLLNDINEGLKMEEEVETTKKREFCHERNILSYLSFFNENIIPIKVSFLALKGSILEESKTPKLAEFFSYSKDDIKSLSLESLMPDYLAQYHDRFFQWHLNKPRKVAVQQMGRKFIDTYGRKKTGLIFPINLYIGYGFEFKEDFVLQGLVCEETNLNNTVKTVIFDDSGKIQGMDAAFFKFLGDNKVDIKPDDLLLINIFSLVPGLSEILEKNEGFKRKAMALRQQISVFQLPRNIREIIEILRLKRREEADFTNRMSYYSGLTGKTKKSSNNSKNHSNRSMHTDSDRKKGGKTQFLTKLFTSKPDISLQKRSELEEKSHENKLEDREVISELLDKKNCAKFRIYFDLKGHAYAFGEKETQKVPLFELRITRVRIMVANTSMTYQETSKVSLSMSNNMLFPEVEPVADVESGFIHMPPENVASFRHIHQTTLEDEQQISKILEGHNLEFSNRISPKIQITSDRDNAVNKNNLQTDANLLTQENPTNPHDLNNHKDFLMVSTERKGVRAPIEENREESVKDSQEEDLEHEKTNGKNDEKAVNTDKLLMKEVEKFSGKQSSISSVKKAFSIFASISNIQKERPNSIFRLRVAFSLEVLLVMIFCILVYRFTVQYMSDYYDPLELGLENVSQLTTLWCTMTLAATEIELYRNNLTAIGPESLEAEIIYEIFNRSFLQTKEILNFERDLETRFTYQTVLKSSTVKFTETTFYSTSTVAFLDAMDEFVGAAKDVLIQDLTVQSVKNLEIFPLNFESVVDVYNELLDILSSEFLSSNVQTSRNILIVMLVFLILLVPLKLLELREIIAFFQNIVKLINIFLRVNQKSAFNEYLFQREILETAFGKDKKELLFISFPDRTLNKKSFDIPTLNESQEKNSPSKKKSNKTAKNAQKFSFHNLRPLGLSKPKLLLLFSFFSLFCFFFFIYLDWTIVDSKISDLIQIHNFFYNFYSMPSHVLALNLLMFREKLITIPELQTQPEPSQYKAAREATVINELREHLGEFDDNASLFPKYLFEVAGDIGSEELNILIQNDICKELYDEGLIYAEEEKRCQTLLNNAFQQGIISVMNQMLNTVKLQQDLVAVKQTPEEIASQLQDIKEYLASNENLQMLISEHFFEETNLKIFRYLTKYYTQLIYNEMNSLETMILIFSVGIGIITIGVMEYYRRNLTKSYCELSMCLSLIPYERLINDEQTVFLIKKFGKN